MELLRFITSHRSEIIKRARGRVLQRHAPLATHHQLTNGVPLFLTQLCAILGEEASNSAPDGAPMERSATQHGVDLLAQGFTIAQVVHDYGAICQSITELAVDLDFPIGAQEFQTLNRCLDNAIADAVTGYSLQRDADAKDDIERQGFLAHELRNHLNSAALALQVLKSGRVGVSGSTVAVLERSLRGLRELIDRSLSEVRLAAGAHRRERIRLAEFIEDLEITTSLDASERGLEFSVERVDNSILVDVDRHLFASAISNLLQNAFKFTGAGTRVSLRIHTTATTVAIEIEDRCGGLPAGAADMLFQPFERRGTNAQGLGLGLAISRRAIENDGGTISVRDLPGKGCIFTIQMPRAESESAPAVA